MPLVNALSDVDPTAITLVKKGANNKRIFLKKEAVENEFPLVRSRILKDSAEDWSVLYCVVAEPDALELPGLVGDGETPDVWASAEEIRKAAHKLLKNGAYVNLVHDGLPTEGISIVENAVAPADFTVVSPDGEEVTIKKGSWYVGIEVDDATKAAVDSGDIESISMEAMGIRTAIEKSADDAKNGAMRRALKAMADALFPGENVVPDTEPIQKEAVDFNDFLAREKFNRELPSALWALEDAIYYAFSPTITTGEDPKAVVKRSLEQFNAFALSLLESMSLADKTALQKQADTIRENRPTPQEDDTVPISDKDFEDLRKSVAEQNERLDKLVEKLGSDDKDPKEPVKKEEPTDETEPAWASKLLKAIEGLGSGGSQQSDLPELDRETLMALRKSDPEAYDNYVLLHG